MFDKQKFEVKKLKNGITSYFLESKEVQFTTISLQIPVGSVNNVSPYYSGTFHFLEHIVIDRSKAYPKLGGYIRELGFRGGTYDASTSNFATTFSLSVPSKHFKWAISGFLSSIFEPLILQQDIDVQKGVIANEKRMRRWFPASSEKGQYLDTKWKYSLPYSKDQLFGSNKDLSRMSVENLVKAHENYFNQDTILVGSGVDDLFIIHEKLEEYKLNKIKLRENYNLLSWKRKNYHEKSFRDIDRFEFWTGTFTKPLPDIKTIRMINFIIGYLTNQVHGPLYRWLREELGWVYEISSFTSSTKFFHDWDIMFPLGSREQVETVRKELPARIEAALKDERSIKLEVERILGSSAFWYLTPFEVVSSGLNCLNTYGRIVTVSDWTKLIKECLDTKALQKVYGKYLSGKNAGSMLAIPKS